MSPTASGGKANVSERAAFIFPDSFVYVQDLMDDFVGSGAISENSIVMISNQFFKVSNLQFGIRIDYSSVLKAPDLVDIK